MRTEAEGKALKIAEVYAASQSGDGTVSSGWVLRTGFDAARVFASVEAPTGTPDALTATLVVQDASDGSGTGADTYATVEAATSVLTGGLLEGAVNLREAGPYIRVQTVLEFTGGTTPAAVTAVGVALTGADTIPQ